MWLHIDSTLLDVNVGEGGLLSAYSEIINTKLQGEGESQLIYLKECKIQGEKGIRRVAQKRDIECTTIYNG